MRIVAAGPADAQRSGRHEFEDLAAHDAVEAVGGDRIGPEREPVP
jgi:hypothetical protein